MIQEYQLRVLPEIAGCSGQASEGQHRARPILDGDRRGGGKPRAYAAHDVQGVLQGRVRILSRRVLSAPQDGSRGSTPQGVRDEGGRHRGRGGLRQPVQVLRLLQVSVGRLSRRLSPLIAVGAAVSDHLGERRPDGAEPPPTLPNNKPKLTSIARSYGQDGDVMLWLEPADTGAKGDVPGWGRSSRTPGDAKERWRYRSPRR